MLAVFRNFYRLVSIFWAPKKFYAFFRPLAALLVTSFCLSVVPTAYAPAATLYQSVEDFDSSTQVNLFKATSASLATVNVSFEEDMQRLAQVPETLVETQSDFLEVPQSTGPIPSYLYLHFGEVSDAPFSWVPIASESGLSENDVLVDLSEAIHSECSYEVSEYYRHLFALTVYREAGNQPFLGMLLVAEGLVGRCRSGNYGTDISAILVSGYRAQADENGDLHICHQNGEEVLEPSQAAIDAVDLALSGSQVSYLLLQAATQACNEQYNLQLSDNYYKWCAIYHFNPELISEEEVQKRTISRVPVSFQFYDHIFYGYWLSESAQLDL